ncbi:hypothetical protein [uncultured Secundilactobacillus sp.]|uniref:hypothetical protein n=1 Tax=uncultured Secundilactobacillus sp. TaxID=2813935 RepID=UPI002585D838|nr:hypothetical protein [uncultured Secundilactobacillus sp.]
MLKIAKGRISYLAVIGAVIFMTIQVIANLNLPSLTSDEEYQPNHDPEVTFKRDYV